MKVCCPNSYRSDPNGSEKTEPGNVLPEPGVCGDPLTNRIYGGSETKLDEFPWMALLQYKTGWLHLLRGSQLNFF